MDLFDKHTHVVAGPVFTKADEPLLLSAVIGIGIIALLMAIGGFIVGRMLINQFSQRKLAVVIIIFLLLICAYLLLGKVV